MHKKIITKLYLILISILFWAWIQPETLVFLFVIIFELQLFGIVVSKNTAQINREGGINSKSFWFIVGIVIITCCLFYYKFYSVLVHKKLGNILIVLWKDWRNYDFNKQDNSEEKWLGIERICIGYAKKVIIADTLGRQISLIHSAMKVGENMIIPAVDRPTYWICAFIYMFQIYYDFSGYSDIAIGLCRFFGFRVKENFNYPYISQSVSDFWRRWHISLGSWFREYVYIPLGGNRKGCVYFNLIVVFLMTGIWHGLGWNYVIWGIINGLAVCFEKIFDKMLIKLPSWLKHIYILVFLYFSWIIFSSNDLHALCEYGKIC